MLALCAARALVALARRPEPVAVSALALPILAALLVLTTLGLANYLGTPDQPLGIRSPPSPQTSALATASSSAALPPSAGPSR